MTPRLRATSAETALESVPRAVPERWEHGSDFHFGGSAGKVADVGLPSGILVASGRDALLCLLRDGHAHRGWSRLWLPSYFCQEVVGSLRRWGGTVELYRHAPNEAIPNLSGDALRSGDVVLLVNYFGLATKAPALSEFPEGVIVIEDHTHDPWSDWARGSVADYCIASLRKTLPVPDGGIVWSRRGRPLPPTPPLTAAHHARAAERFAAMALKAYYLAGGPVDKTLFRTHYVQSEERIDEGCPSAISPYAEEVLEGVDAASWRAQRRRNFDVLVHALGGLEALSVLPGAPGSVPYMVQFLLTDVAARDGLRAALIRERIYPAVLWSLEAPMHPSVPKEHVDLSRRLLGVHCDGRYDAGDMRRVAAVISAFFGSSKGESKWLAK